MKTNHGRRNAKTGSGSGEQNRRGDRDSREHTGCIHKAD